jgi:RimJ/RimL family protein N-acetyltransferase
MIVPETFDTTRLRLRRPRVADAAAIFESWAQDPEVTRHLVWVPHQDIGETIAYIARCASWWDSGDGYVWVIEERASGELVGSLAARPGGHGVNVGYLLAQGFWGKGYMTEALTALTVWLLEQPDVFRVWATCDTENVRSARTLESAGFSLEGVLRRWDIHPNVSTEPRDARCYSRVR